MRQKNISPRILSSISALLIDTFLSLALSISFQLDSKTSLPAIAAPLPRASSPAHTQNPSHTPVPISGKAILSKTSETKIPLGAGSEILIAHSTTLAADCTLTAIGHDSQGELIGFTAGHCGEVGEPILTPYDLSKPIGRIIKVNPNLDYAVIRFDPASVSPQRDIKNFPIDSYETTPHSNPRIACKLGAASGLTCGETTIMQSDLQTGQICILSGDSGAPVAVGTMLIGMVNAHHVFGCIGPESGTTISAILHDLGTHFTLI